MTPAFSQLPSDKENVEMNPQTGKQTHLPQAPSLGSPSGHSHPSQLRRLSVCSPCQALSLRKNSRFRFQRGLLGSSLLATG